MSKRVAIVQSNYIPWKGYFDLIASVDSFIFYDDVQYTRRDWRNRNQIKTPDGLKWLTIPVKVKGKYHQNIDQVEIDGEEWRDLHWKSLYQNYRRARYFSEVADMLEPLYRGSDVKLTDVNRRFTSVICEYLKIDTEFYKSSDYSVSGDASQRLANLCEQVSGSVYVSGPSAKDYMNLGTFSERGIDIEWFDYSGYPEYEQLWEGFSHGVSVLDLLFNCGPFSGKYMKYVA